jgi:hypothetical protein
MMRHAAGCVEYYSAAGRTRAGLAHPGCAGYAVSAPPRPVAP